MLYLDIVEICFLLFSLSFPHFFLLPIEISPLNYTTFFLKKKKNENRFAEQGNEFHEGIFYVGN
jgi:hypothetical protein